MMRLVGVARRGIVEACMPARRTVDLNANECSRHCNNRIVPQPLVRTRGAAIVKDCQPAVICTALHITSTISCSRTPSHTRKHYKQHHASKDVHPTKNTSGGRGPEGRGRATGDPPPQAAGARHARRTDAHADGPRRLRRGLLHGNKFWIRTLGTDEGRC